MKHKINRCQQNKEKKEIDNVQMVYADITRYRCNLKIYRNTKAKAICKWGGSSYQAIDSNDWEAECRDFQLCIQRLIDSNWNSDIAKKK